MKKTYKYDYLVETNSFSVYMYYERYGKIISWETTNPKLTVEIGNPKIGLTVNVINKPIVSLPSILGLEGIDMIESAPIRTRYMK